MGGWIGEWMDDGWMMDGWIDEWVGGWVDSWLGGG